MSKDFADTPLGAPKWRVPRLGCRQELHELLREATHIVTASADEQVRALAQDLPRIEGGEASALSPLRVAFVGQYDAGKSTILSALTGRRDIRISSRVETSEVSEFDWNGLHVVDTPGIHAGHPDHDTKTYTELRSSAPLPSNWARRVS